MDILKEYNVIDYYKLLTLKYKQLGLNEIELITIQLIMLLDHHKTITPELLSKYMQIDEAIIDKCLAGLVNKKVISFYRNHFYFDDLYKRLLDEEIETNSDLDELSYLVDIFSKELGKLLSPIEVDVIRSWRSLGVKDELILEALKEAIIAQIYNIRYIDRIINNWAKRNILTVDDLQRISRI